jgi:hypothetical protein
VQLTSLDVVSGKGQSPIGRRSETKEIGMLWHTHANESAGQLLWTHYLEGRQRIKR